MRGAYWCSGHCAISLAKRYFEGASTVRPLTSVARMKLQNCTTLLSTGPIGEIRAIVNLTVLDATHLQAGSCPLVGSFDSLFLSQGSTTGRPIVETRETNNGPLLIPIAARMSGDSVS
jgi:hypothetical protein